MNAQLSIAVTDKAAGMHWDHIYFCFWSVNKKSTANEDPIQFTDGLAHEEDLKI